MSFQKKIITCNKTIVYIIYQLQIAPTAMSDAAMLAPEDIFKGKGDVKDEVELTQAERKRRRANKKRKYKGNFPAAISSKIFACLYWILRFRILFFILIHTLEHLEVYPSLWYDHKCRFLSSFLVLQFCHSAIYCIWSGVCNLCQWTILVIYCVDELSLWVGDIRDAWEWEWYGIGEVT